jgi:DNA-binding transcriptional LysR family regulator
LVEKGVLGHLRVGIAAMFASHIMDDVIISLTSAGPQASFTITDGLYEDLIEDVRDGTIDAAFTNFPQNLNDEDLIAEPLYELSVSIGVSRDTAAHIGSDPKISDLSDLRWLVVDQPHAMGLLDFFFSENGLRSPANLIQTNSITLLQSLLAKGPYVAILSQHMLENNPNGDITILDLAPMPIRRQAGLIYRKDLADRPSLQSFFSEVRRVCAAIESQS